MAELQSIEINDKINKEIYLTEQGSAPSQVSSAKRTVYIISVWIFGMLFLAGFLLGALYPIHQKYTATHAALVMGASIAGLLTLTVPLILKKAFRLEISLMIALFWWAFSLLYVLG